MMKLFPDVTVDSQMIPAVIPKLEIDPDPAGAIASFQPDGPTETAKNAFFQDLRDQWAPLIHVP